MNSTYLNHSSVILANVLNRLDFDAKLSRAETFFESDRKLDLNDFDAKKFISDRKVLKAISHRDSYAIAAIEQIKNAIAKNSPILPEQKGLFVGACPSSVTDYDNYAASTKRCIDTSGQYIEKYFGRECMTSRPTTLLLGLPNNVLCYGSMLLEARGPNNNFVSEGVSSAQALQSARRSLLLNRLQEAYVGGYSHQSDPVKINTAAKLGHSENRTFADGAAFARMSPVKSTHSVEYFGTVFRCAQNYMTTEFEGLVLDCIDQLLKDNQVNADGIGLVFVPESTWIRPDSPLFQKLHSRFSSETTHLLSLDEKFGYTSELSTMIEISAIESINSGRVNELLLHDEKNINCRTASNKYKVVLSSSLDGDIAASLFL